MKISGSTSDEKFKSIETTLNQLVKKKEDFKKPKPIQTPYSISSYVYSIVNSGDAILRHIFPVDTSIDLGVYIEDSGKGTASIIVDVVGTNSNGKSFKYALSPGLNSLDTVKLSSMDRLIVRIVYDNEEQKPLGIWVTGACI